MRTGAWLVIVGIVILFAVAGSPYRIAFAVVALAMIAAGIAFLRGSKNVRIEVTDDGIKFFAMTNRVWFQAIWADVTEYASYPAPDRFINAHLPYWKLTAHGDSAWIPRLADNAGFQRIALERLPAQAIPERYRTRPPVAIDFDLPIKQFSLIADEEGLIVDSAVNRAHIIWKDAILLEEYAYSHYWEGNARETPVMFICTSTDSFLLTRFWDRYDDIRRLAIAKAPLTALVVQPDS